jgi:outer membrane cobalamin receptor
VVVERTARPVRGIQLRFQEGPWVLTDVDGRFSAAGLAPGVHSVAFVTRFCEVALLQLIVAEGATGDTTLVVPGHLGNVDPSLDLVWSEGVVLTRDEIEDMRVRRLTDVVRRVAPEMVVGNPGQGGGAVGRAVISVRGPTPPTILLDGVWLGTDSRVLWDVRPENVEAIQIMRGASGGWQYGSPGGLLRIWTRRGRGVEVLGAPESCVVEGFTRGRG